MRRRRSLRWNALLVVLAVAVFPLVYVVVSGEIEGLFVGRTLSSAASSAHDVRDVLAAGGTLETIDAATADVEAIARLRAQRIRVVRSDGMVLHDADQELGDSWLFRLGDLFYGPGRAAGLAQLEQRQGGVGARVEVERAMMQGEDRGCEHSVMGNIDICHVAERVDMKNGAAVVVHVQGSSRRALDALYAQRRQLVKLTSAVLFGGLLLAWWMGSRMVRPVESLRAEVLARARAAVPKAELPVRREDEVGDLTLAFNALLGALAERSRANEAFVADLAHEFKNPVAAIRACAERLEDAGALDETRAKRLALVLGQSSRRLDALVSQFLELARAEAGLSNETRELVDIAALARGIVDVARSDPRFAKVTFELKVAGGGHEVNAVAGRLESALRNLVDNAASFAGADGRVIVLVSVKDGAVEVTVDDTGPGIAAVDLPRVFDRFFTKRESENGTGLGLALTRAVVQAHGGTVHAESPPGQGARFVVRVPFGT